MAGFREGVVVLDDDKALAVEEGWKKMDCKAF